VYKTAKNIITSFIINDTGGFNMNIREKQRKISIDELPRELPDFEACYESKESAVKKWIINWIKSALSAGRIKENDIIPQKIQISRCLGVSSGTVQNAIRAIEDEGFLKSRQKIGTMISAASNPIGMYPKADSKRGKAVLAVKKIILMNNYKVNKPIPSIRKMSEFIGISQNTTRLAYELLCREGLLESMQMRASESNWYLKKKPDFSGKDLKPVDTLEADTLADKITAQMKDYLSEKYEIGSRIPSHETLAAEFQTSIKTINDCIKRLHNQGIVITRRGKYGCILAQNPKNPVFEPDKENSIFVKAKDAEFYSWQKTASKLISYISSSFAEGDKLPSIKQFSEKYNVSTNTIRKVLLGLEAKGCIRFERGKSGGTYMIQKPEISHANQYQWLSISRDYI